MYISRLMEQWLEADAETKETIESAYMDFIHSQTCEISDGWPVVAHHYRSQEYAKHGFPVGMGLKPPDIFAIPLTPEYHNQGDHSIHALGNERFAKFHNFDIDITLAGLHNKFYHGDGLKY